MDKARFFPQIKFFGEKLNEKISNTKPLIVGIGGIGSWVAEMLARMGVREIGIIDYDIVEVHNLTRQNYRERDINKLKIDALEERIKEINSSTKVRKFREIKLDYFKEFDVFFDCTDNIETKYLLNEISVYMRKPYIFGSIAGNSGFFGYINPDFFCFYDIYKGKRDLRTCRDTGIDVSSVFFISSLMVKLFVYSLENRIPKVYHFNLSNLSIEEIKVKREDCKICLRKDFEYLKNGYI